MTATLDIPSQVHRILEQVGLEPRGVQSESIEKGLLDGGSILVCSPTGSGKTLVGEIALLRSVTSGKRGLYLTPLRALADQIFDTLKERYTPLGIRIGISTGDFQTDGSALEEYDIIVSTYERADSLLRHKSPWMEQVATLVVDEIQTISEGNRGARLESVIIRFKRIVENLQIIALSATIGFPEQLADWLGCRLVESIDRPVPLLCNVIAKPNKEAAVLKYVMTTIQKDGQVLVFHRTRREAEAEARRLAEHVGKQLTQNEREYLVSELDSIEHWNANIPKDLRSLLHNGIAYHHAGLGVGARKLVEHLFKTGRIRAISATTTLSSGMNLPARTVVIANARSPIDYRHIMPPNQMHQMLGRAGRPGLDSRGYGVIIADSRGQADDIIQKSFLKRRDDTLNKDILEPKYEAVTSAFRSPDVLEEQLLVALDMLNEASLEEIENGIFGETYLLHQAVRNTYSPMRLIYLDAIDAMSALECHALSDTIRAARGGVLGTVRIREVNDSVIGGMVAQKGGNNATCRFSTRTRRSGTIEGPMCSCGRPIDGSGILCPHLVTLGMMASKEHSEVADYIIPLALGESSPSGSLIRLQLIEGAEDGRVKITRLGRLVSRLYLRPGTARELLAMVPFVKDTVQLVSMLKHLVSLESNQTIDDTFEMMIGLAASTRMHMVDMAEELNLSIGDLSSLLERSRWLLYSIAAIAREGNLSFVSEHAQQLWEDIDSRFSGDDNGNN
ncbi:MAG: DEAD/DEAH box helicase [Candidatus Thorarchaeota archaeon]